MDAPPSLHRYFYAHARPTFLVDPTGHQAEKANSGESEQSIREILADLQRIHKEQAALEAQGNEPSGFEAFWEGVKKGYRAVKDYVAVTEDGPVAGGDPSAEAERQAAARRGDPEALAQQIQADKRRTLETAAKGARIAKQAGEEALSMASGTAGDVYTASTGVDPGTGEEVSKFWRAVAAVGAVLPWISGKEIRKGQEVGEELLDTPPLRSGRTALGEFDIDRYGSFGSRARSGDELAGHEMLQNAWLREHGHVRSRGAGTASRDNPAVALTKEMHDQVGIEQRRLGLFDRSRLRGMSAEENIALNAEAMRSAGVPEHVVQTLQKEAQQHASTAAR